MFDFLKKKKEDEIPDIGAEDSGELDESSNDFDKGTDDKEQEKEDEFKPAKEKPLELRKIKPKEEKEDEPEEEEEPKQKKYSAKMPKDFQYDRSLDFEKTSARLESLNEIVKGYSERFSQLSEQIGEVRSMAISNEKEIAKSITEGEKAADIVKEVKPDKLRLDYQRLEMKISELAEKIEANKQYEETLMSELKELKRKEGIFIGTDALLKLNDEVKQDLIEMQKLGVRVKVNADKSEQIFIELKSGFAESQKTNETIAEMDVSYSDIKKTVEKLKIDFGNIATKNELETFKKTLNNKLAVITQVAAEVDNVREENERALQLIETVAGIAKSNKEDIADIAMTIGDDRVQKVGDYENQMASVLSIIDTLAGEIASIKKKTGMSENKIIVKHNENILGKEKIKPKNFEVHSKIHDNLSPEKPEVPKAIADIPKNSEKEIAQFDRDMEK